MTKTRVALLVTAVIANPAVARDADAIWFGGPIITVDDKTPAVEAVAVKDGKIVATGKKTAVLKAEQGNATILHDLAGKTLVPGFVDAHGHLTGVGVQALSANLLPPPDGPAQSIPQIQAIMRDYIAKSPVVKQYGIAIGFNYDDSQLSEKRAPTRVELDAVSTEIPIMLTHQSGHLGAYNSKALALAGITADSANPEGGVIQREADGKTPNGVLEENAHNAALGKLFPKLTPQDAMRIVTASQAIYAANGYTTVQEGRADPGTLALLTGASKAGKLDLDVVVYPDLVMNAKSPALTGPLMARSYADHLRIGGVKLTFDGSPQGKTAWFTKPYFHVPEGQKPSYNGYPSFPKTGEAAGWVDMAYADNWQLMVHANGDAAIDELIGAVGAAQKAHPGSDRRTVLIHGQYLRADQIPRLKALGIFPALFPMHTFYWGDWHRESVAGPQRAEFISPTGSVLKAGMKFSIHHDAPVTFPNSMRVYDSAVNRTTRTGHVLGPDQRISPMVALKAMTIWPAYQHFEEATKGSISVGKVADLVVLDRNPLTAKPATIKDIKVMQTIKAGKTVYDRAAP
ncbi:MAG: amidohydrolase [Polymorphobacter sp.]